MAQTEAERKAELLRELVKCAANSDTEDAHYAADRLLLGYIRDLDITEAYDSVRKWYA